MLNELLNRCTICPLFPFYSQPEVLRRLKTTRMNPCRRGIGIFSLRSPLVRSFIRRHPVRDDRQSPRRRRRENRTYILFIIYYLCFVSREQLLCSPQTEQHL
ncbi:hypothetical protein FOZ62_027065 [Perkinsus olseni]|uniref:Uncharacterized protein n=1 Tax=Perkinsus olseni TaxID=32597 RepID=A0A7J6TXD8_PEROL|nr:hypothetical protein FOZ62_027065 [Perkinsus olseni]